MIFNANETTNLREYWHILFVLLLRTNIIASYVQYLNPRKWVDYKRGIILTWFSHKITVVKEHTLMGANQNGNSIRCLQYSIIKCNNIFFNAVQAVVVFWSSRIHLLYYA